MTPRSSGEWSIAVRRQAAVARVGQLGLEGVDADELMGETLRSIADTLGVADVALLEVRDGVDLVGRAAVVAGEFLGREIVGQVHAPLTPDSLAGFAADQGTPVVSADVLVDHRFHVLASDYGIPVRAAITAPVGWGGQPWAVLAVYDRQVRQWHADDVHFVVTMANTIGLAVSRQRIEDELRDSSARLELSLAAGNMGAWTWDVANDDLSLSPSVLAIYGIDAASFGGSGDELLERVHPDDQASARGDAFEAVQTTGEHHSTYRVVRPDGEVRWVESWGRLLTEPGEQVRMVGVIADITDRSLADESRAEMLAVEKRARASVEAARERLGILADASDRFSATLDPDEVAETLAEVCVPLMADVCMVDVLRDDGRLEEVTARARDPQSLLDVRELRRRRALEGGVGGLWSERRVAGRVESVMMTRITEERMQQSAIDDGHMAVMRRFGARSSVVVPMVARDKVIGVLTMIFNVTERRYDVDSLALAEEVAARAALALDNARLFESRNRVARSLQAALLPPALPDIPWLETAARYRVAESDTEIGGDFYDIIEVGERAWGVVVGDVCGRGPDAAAITGLMRHSVRTAVVREALPSRVLAQTNDAVIDQIDDSRFCTAAYLRIEQRTDGTVRARASSAGHPRPVLLTADGRPRVLDCSGLLLGVVPSPTLVDVDIELEPGDAVILYTDGVTEARRGRELFGEKRLFATVAALAGKDAEGIASGIEAAVSAFQDDATDDVAILVVRVPLHEVSVARSGQG